MRAEAANFTQASIRLDRMTASNAARELVVVKPATAGTATTVVVTWAAGFTVNATASAITVSTTGLPATYQGLTLVSWPGIGSAATAVSGQSATFASTTLTVGTVYGFYITGGITNPASTGQYKCSITTQAAGPTTIDSSQVGLNIITNDQVVITGTVPPNFSLALSANTDTFPSDFSTSAITTSSGVTVTISTNAFKGYVAWVKSLNTGLTSTNTGQTIATSGSVGSAPTTMVNNSNMYQLWAILTTHTAGGTGSTTIDAAYNGSSTSGGTLSSTLVPFVSGNGTTQSDVITLKELVTINSITAAAADYSDTLTIVGAGSF